MITVAQVTERIRRIISGGVPSSRDNVRDAEIRLAMTGYASRLLKAEILENTYKDGSRVPPGSVTVTVRELVPLRGDANYLDVALPMQPIALPRGAGLMGVFDDSFLDIVPDRSPAFNRTLPTATTPCEYIPVEAGQTGAVFGSPEFRGLLGRSFYTWEGGFVRIWQPRQPDKESAKFAMRLVVPPLDFAQDNDPVGLPADMVEELIFGVAAQYGAGPKATRDESNFSTPQTTGGK